MSTSPLDRSEWEDLAAQSEPYLGGSGLDLWGMVLRRKWLIVLGAIVGGALIYDVLDDEDPASPASE